ncbi:MAG TPA: tetratricopeptide repeat protein [Alphaproteobacteria bacterium]|nr:tetratricopeptide repeat protein [Alphaproteobacteria bacterium]
MALAAGIGLAGAAPVWAAASGFAGDRASRVFYKTCMALARRDPGRALGDALAFDATGAAYPARHCAATALLRLGRYRQAAVMLDGLASTMKRAPRQLRSRIFHQAGLAWLSARDVTRADAALVRAVALDGHNLRARADRGLLRAQTNRMDEAIHDFNAVIAAAPDDDAVLVLRAATYRKLKRLDRARDDLQRVLKRKPDHADALLERGILRLVRRDLLGARADWKRILQVAPGSAAAVVARRKLAFLNRRLK